MNAMTSHTRIVLRTAAAVALGITAVSLNACKRGDANAEPATSEPVLIGPENITIVKSQEIRTGPAISGALQPEQEATVRAAHSPDLKQKLVDQGAEPVGNSPAEFAAMLKSEVSRWAEIVKVSGAKAD